MAAVCALSIAGLALLRIRAVAILAEPPFEDGPLW